MTTTVSGAALAQQLHADGHLPIDWMSTFTAVPRERFIPARIWVRGDGGYHPVDRAQQPEQWHSLVYSDTALVTQVEDPPSAKVALTPSSSASMPRIVATMLDTLDVRDGQRVLEIGTGTGYNAALLAHRLGEQNVTSIEVDLQLADIARAALKTAGYAPTVITGDGAAGWPEGALYDRIIVTCALAEVPYPLVEQTAPGGLIVLPWGTGLYNGVLVRLTAQHSPDGPEASGPVTGGCAFMWMRAHAPADRDVMAAIHHPADARAGRTSLDPRRVLGDDDMAFTAGLLVPGCRYAVGHGPDGEFTLWIADTTTGSWASVDYTPGATAYDIQQHGPRRLWVEVEAAYRWWTESGAPERTRYGLTVGPAGQHVWLDRPDQLVPTSR